MNLYIDTFDDDLFDNDRIHVVSDDPMPQDVSSHAAPTDSFANPNLTLASNKHKAVDINDWVESNCKHLNFSKRQALAEVLIKYPSIWDNKLGTYPDNKVHLELSDDPPVDAQYHLLVANSSRKNSTVLFLSEFLNPVDGVNGAPVPSLLAKPVVDVVGLQTFVA